ncbi:MAG: lipid-binding SYLF domain-containing protein [Usitatibacter sp.]
MKIRTLLAMAGTVFAFCAGNAFAATDVAAKQAEIRKAVAATLDKFYKAKPELKDQVHAAPGYAVFTTFGVSFVFGGAGGTGLAHDPKSGHDTFMHMAQASAGVQAGIAQSQLLIVFKTRKAFDNFVKNGWEVGAGAAASAGADNKSAGGGEGEQFVSDANYYTLTKNGLEVGGVIAGTKFYKERDLN